MKKILFLLFFSTAVLFVLRAQQTFNKRLHFGYPAAVLTSVVATDSCFYATGVIADSVYPYRVGTLFAKFDLEGNVIFNKAITNTEKSYATWANTLIPLGDGSFALSGYTTDTLMRAILYKFDSNGDSLFTKKYLNLYYPEQDYLNPFDMKSTPDGGFVMTSWMGTLTLGNGDVSVLKVDSLGNEQWHKAYGNNLRERPESIIVAPDGDIIVGAVRGNNNLVLENYTYQTWIFGLTSQGDLKWTYLSPNNVLRDAANDMILLGDGSLLVASGVGTEYPRPSVNVVYYEKYLMKLDPDKNFDWDMEFIGEVPIDAVRTSNLISISSGEEFLATGTSFYDLPGQVETWTQKGWLFKGSIIGDSLWTREYVFLEDQKNQHTIYDVKETKDNGFIIVGESIDYVLQDSVLQQAWLLKVDEYGCLVPGCHLPDAVQEAPDQPQITLKPYPNPAMDELFVFFKVPFNGRHYRFQIVDSMGRIVEAFSSDSSEITFILDTSRWAGGIYFLQCRDEEGGMMSKAIEVVK